LEKKLILFLTIIVFGSSVFFVAFYKKQIFRSETVTPLTKSWEKIVPNQLPPKGLVSLSAESCGQCHVDHYNEWKLSTHAHAWTDPQFQAELKKESSPFLCKNCHIPIQNQQEDIVTGLINGDIYKPVSTKNPMFDKNLQQEGINCASCHVRDNHVISATDFGRAPHAVKKDPLFLSETMCISCHNANAVVTPTLACTFETGDEWRKGPFFGKKNCISCHMEERNSAIVAGYPSRKNHFHGFPGSGIPKFDTVKAYGLNGLKVTFGTMPSKFNKGDSLKINLSLKNEYAGHRVPSGDPERFWNIVFELKDSNGTTINSQKHRIGEVWQWYPTAKKISDNNMNPGETRNYLFNYKALKPGKYKLVAAVTKHRMDIKTAEYNKLGKNYPLFIPVFNKEYSFTVI
jgi:Cytochrome c554 and c-prime